MTAFDPRILPPGLPVPEDGAARHLPGADVPELSLPSAAGPLHLRAWLRANGS